MSQPAEYSGHDPATGRMKTVGVADGWIAAISDAPEQQGAPWLSPGLVDLQVNGFAGLDLNDGALTVPTVVALCHRLADEAVTRFLPTVVSASEPRLIQSLQTLAKSVETDALAARMIAGIPVEGPFISVEDRPRGAHPAADVRAADSAEIRRWQEAAGGLVRIVTLAAESPGACDAIGSSISIVATSAIAGYVVAKFPFRSINIVFFLFLATANVPFEVYMIPLYFQVKQLGLLNSVPGLLVGYLVMSFGIFLIRQNVLSSIPDELIEAARVDGAGEFWIFWHIVLPLLRGPLAALAVLAFFQSWTAFAWPIIVATKRSAYTIEVGLALFQTGYTVDLRRLSAASACVLVPSLLAFVLLRRSFVQGVAASGMKE
ncbi:ABC transporter permease subunit [Oceaniovalibus sp. ACAM 378]|uniref:ABC transporter permease subunit n=1 Tax=Oceaniovalibus sp. ACAM 378 TaxID=2599923 RepID=UPI0021050358|nr:ABC transporter permease subunit [Oceaniovalibus sp. ACAM 378]